MFSAQELMFIFDAVANFSGKFCGDHAITADAFAQSVGVKIEEEMERLGYRWVSPVPYDESVR